jgi:hypothetical protein
LLPDLQKHLAFLSVINIATPMVQNATNLFFLEHMLLNPNQGSEPQAAQRP